MNNLAIFSYEEETLEILKYVDYLKYNAVYIIDPFCRIKCNSEKCKFVCAEKEIVLDCDTLLIGNDQDVEVLEMRREIIKVFKEQNKRICLPKIIYDEMKLKENCSLIEHSEIIPNIKAKKLINIPAPVVTIMGDGANCDKFELLLKLKKTLEDDGYKVMGISGKKYSSLFNILPIPKFLFEAMSLTDKIVAFNHYLYSVSFEENPDIILISAPGGVMPICEEAPEDFGEYCYVIANAAPPDILIRSMYFNKYNEKYIDEDKKKLQYRMNVVPDIYYMSRTAIVYPVFLFDKIEYVKIPDEKAKEIEELLYENNVQIYSNLDKNSIKTIKNHIVDSLSDGFSII